MPWWSCFECMNLRNADDVQVLDFSHHLLHEVPPNVFQHERTLEELHLNCNRITDLPRQLFYCHELKELNLNDNEISVLPAAISSLTNLQKINLSKNSLTTVVDTIKSCKHLIYMDISLNNLLKLPDAITNLISMQELYLNDTFLEFLPANFGRLVNLRILELRDNNLSTLPKSIARLSNLTRIDIGHNEFTELPEVIGQLTNLTELWMDNNRIRRVSANVGNLRKLVHFEASNNLLTYLPNEVSNWVALQELSISVNDFKHLPFSIGMMRSLVAIKADENNLQELPDSICQLENLEELMVSHNDLFRLPNSIGLLRKLRFLTADENLLRNLPNELCSCIALTILSVRGNKLVDIPPDIGHLTNLRVINIVNNFISHLPVSVLNLQQLSALWISDNQSQPLMPLQKEYSGTEPGRVHLTCFMLPQMANTKPKLPVTADDEAERDSLRHLTAKQMSAIDETIEVIPKRRICFASDPVATIDQTAGRLMRSPTPYPKELRVLAKYAKHIQTNGNAEYAEGEDIDNVQVTMVPVAEIKEARVTSAVAMPPHIVHHNGIEVDQFDALPLGNDEIDNKAASCLYATIDKHPAINAGSKVDYEIVSNCSSSVARNFAGADEVSVRSNLDDAIRLQQQLYGSSVEYQQPIRASPYMEERPLINNNGHHPYNTNHISTLPIVSNQYNLYGEFPPIIDPNNFYRPPSVNYNGYYPPPGSGIGVPENIYTNEPAWTIDDQAAKRLSIDSEFSQTENIQQPPRQPPPYHIARAFTKKSKTDLLIYDHYRNQNGSVHEDDPPVTTTPEHIYQERLVVDRPPLLYNQECEPPKQHMVLTGPDVDSNLNSSNESSNGYISERDSDYQQAAGTKASKSSSWIFGLHKNPTVLQLAVPKNPLDVGFKIGEHPQFQGIFVTEVSVNSAAYTMLQRMDKVLDIDGVDFSRIQIHEALTVLSNAGPIINIMLSRK